MTPEQAVAALRGRRTRAVTKASIHSIKELHTLCLARGIPAVMARPCKDDKS